MTSTARNEPGRRAASLKSEDCDPRTERRASAPVKILHIINDLSTGGAEMMLYKLLSRINRERFEPVVISLTDNGKPGERIEALGINVHSINMRWVVPVPLSSWRLVKLVRRLKPDLIQGWMYHGNLAAQFASAFYLRRVPVLWGIRQLPHTFDEGKRTTRAAIKLCARLSNRPAKIIYNSRASAAQHAAAGYAADKSAVIPNGFDTDLFAPSTDARKSVRSELGVAKNTLLVGLYGRYHPVKGHANFLRAAALVLKTCPDAQFVLSGKEVDWNNGDLRELIHGLGLVERVHLLGERQDMPRITAALDIAVSASNAESFPNVIGEAMSCGVPCVVTNVSDLPWIIGKAGLVVPPRDAAALACALGKLIALGPEGLGPLGHAARLRVSSYFPLQSVAALFEDAYESVLHHHTTETAAPGAEPYQLEANLAVNVLPGGNK